VRRQLIVLASVLLLLPACGGEDTDDSASKTDPTSISGVAVGGEFGAAPEVDIDTPITVDATTIDTVSEGDGDTVSEGATVVVDYVAFLGSSGTQFDSSYDRGQPATVSTERVLPGFAEAIEGQTVGSRVVAAVTPEDGYGPKGNPDAGVTGDDVLIFVIDIVAAPELKETGISGVKLGTYNDQPLVVVDAPLSVPETQVEVLSPGDGVRVQPGAEVTVNYVGVNGSTGVVFDSSFASGKPATFTTDGVVPGFAKALEGHVAGERVVVAMTPEDGYGAAGNPQIGIGPSDPLVFYIDILKTTRPNATDPTDPEPTEPTKGDRTTPPAKD